MAAPAPVGQYAQPLRPPVFKKVYMVHLVWPAPYSEIPKFIGLEKIYDAHSHGWYTFPRIERVTEGQIRAFFRSQEVIWISIGDGEAIAVVVWNTLQEMLYLGLDTMNYDWSHRQMAKKKDDHGNYNRKLFNDFGNRITRLFFQYVDPMVQHRIAFARTSALAAWARPTLPPTFP